MREVFRFGIQFENKDSRSLISNDELIRVVKELDMDMTSQFIHRFCISDEHYIEITSYCISPGME